MTSNRVSGNFCFGSPVTRQPESGAPTGIAENDGGEGTVPAAGADCAITLPGATHGSTAQSQRADWRKQVSVGCMFSVPEVPGGFGPKV